MQLETAFQKQARKQGHIAKHTFDEIKHKSEKMNILLQRCQKIASVDKPTLIVGESGTGKELFVCKSHLKLVFKVAHGAQTLDDSDSADISHIVGKETVEDIYHHVIEIVRDGFDHQHTLRCGKARLRLSGIARDEHDDLVEKL